MLQLNVCSLGWVIESNTLKKSPHGSCEKRLPNASRPDFISTVRPDLSHPAHGRIEEDVVRGILFQRLKVSHFCPKFGVLYGRYYTLL